jgi:hypothetical protein
MPYLRRLPRIPAHGKTSIWLTPSQRDLLLRTAGLSRDLGHLLHRAPVRKGKLEVRVGREALDTMILAGAAAIPALPPGPAPRALVETRRVLDTFVRYLEEQADRFEEESEAGSV